MTPRHSKKFRLGFHIVNVWMKEPGTEVPVRTMPARPSAWLRRSALYRFSFAWTVRLSGTAGELAAYTGSVADNGRWWVNSEKLCQRWRTWLNGQTYCFTLRQDGRLVHWVRNDGLSGKATILR